MLGRHNLPGLQTHLYAQSPDMPAALIAAAETGRVGKPVVTCVIDEHHWTLLGTTAMIGRTEGREALIRLDRVSDIRLAPRHGDSARPGIKQDLAASGDVICLEVSDSNSASHEFCFPTLHEHSAFWNILNRLTNVPKQQGLR